ncbi:MAG: COX15/CtaA family protein [Candidatus Dormibacter sp.]
MSWAPSRAFRRITVATAVATYLLIVMGGVVRVSGSGLGCGAKDQWPLCQGSLLPPLQQAALIEFSHRWLAVIAAVLLLTMAGWVWLRYRAVRPLAVGAVVVVLLYILQIVLGAITVFFNLPSGVIMVHLANALLLLGSLVWIAVFTAMAGSVRIRPALGTMRLTAVAVGATYILALSGAFVVDQGAGAACAGWPLCGNGFTLTPGQSADINLLHRLVAGIVVLLLGYSMMKLRRGRPGDRALRLATLSVTLLIVAQVIAGAVLVDTHLPSAVRGVHLALASALWACVAMSAAIARGTVSTELAGATGIDRPVRAGVAES